ncbi:MAG: PAS domain-containing protein, partial [Chloroflexota bacterium]
MDADDVSVREARIYGEPEQRRLVHRLREANQRLILSSVENRRLAEEARRRVAELDAIFSSMVDPVVVFDRNWVSILANRAALSSAGFDLVGLDGVTMTARLSVRRPDGKPLGRDEYPVTRAMRGEWVKALPVLCTNAAGVDYSLLISASPLTVGDQTAGVVLAARDITELARTEKERERLLQEIDAQRVLLRAVVDNAPAAIAVLDGRELRVKWANDSFRQFLHEEYRDADLAGLPLRDIMSGVAKCGVLDVFPRVVAAGRPLTEQGCEHLTPAGSVTYWNWTVLPLPVPNGDQPDFLMLVTDVTDQVVARKGMEEYVSLVSHDLRSPLTALMGQTQMLQRHLMQKGLEREAKGAESILKSAKRMSAMIDDLVESVRLEAGQVELQRQAVDLCQLLCDLL